MTPNLVSRKVTRHSLIMCCLLFFLPTANASVGVWNQEISYPSNVVEAFSQNPDLEYVAHGDIIYYPTASDAGVSPLGIVPNKWPGGRLYYQFDDSLEPGDKAFFKTHCQTWADNTPIECIERTKERNYVLVSEHAGEGCKQPDGSPGGRVSCSALGMRQCSPSATECSQKLEIFETAWENERTVPHEIGHALGLVHEHQRADREKFVYIVKENIREGARGNFNKINIAQSFTDYDFESVMNYGPCDFAKNFFECNAGDLNEQTIIPRACGSKELERGQSPTKLDFDGIILSYGGALAQMLPRKRMERCGTYIYSLPQLQALCPTGCAQVGETKYTKLEFKYDETCGFFSGMNDWVKYCQTEYNKEFVREKYNSYWAPLECQLGNMNERWVECGCSQVTVQAECTDATARIDRSKLRSLENSDNAKDREAAKILLEFERLIDEGVVQPDLRQPLLQVLVDNYGRAQYVQELENLRCLTLVLLASKRLYLTDYQLDWPGLRALITSTGFKPLARYDRLGQTP